MNCQAVEVKKGKKGIEDVLGSHSGQAVDVVRQIQADGWGKAVVEAYEALLNRRYIQYTLVDNEPMIDATHVLRPEEIELFLQASVKHENHPKHMSRIGIFVSRLVQNSYDAGHNGFHFNTDATSDAENFCCYLHGSEDKPLRITITGDAGHLCGGYSSHLHLTIHGNTAEYCGASTSHSRVLIKGNAGVGCGGNSKDSVFIINGKMAGNVSYTADRSTFKTHNKQTLYYLRWAVSGNNRIVFLEDDRDVILRDYGDDK
jgi:hypothetical protein